ncbi:DUF1684 domain-containing protein [Flavobacterium sp.]|uniref:DUF1684 domain-containing protein n=1 Tax=Flavobacterium sp. TaxID=239 RepID=UPI003D11E791
MKHFLFLFAFFMVIRLQAQTETAIETAFQFQERLNKEFADSISSPLQAEDLVKFKHLDFFPVNDSYLVQAEFIKIKGGKVFQMKTSTDRLPKYKVYGLLRFELDGKKLELFVYQNQELKKKKGYEDYLFLPFTDYTNGVETYGAGRYIDMRIPKTNMVILDFNKAYNPYCAFNKRYSCPVVPSENDLPIEIRAGVKKFHD